MTDRKVTVSANDVLAIIAWAQAAAEHLHEYNNGPEPVLGPVCKRLRDAALGFNDDEAVAS